MRIVTRPDFDGVVCAVLLFEAEQITKPTKWVEPNEMQKGLIDVYDGDIIANLPYNENCSLWFDHHYSNQFDGSFKGVFKLAPSAAGVIFEYYKDRFKRDYMELIEETDKIDSADLSEDEVLSPEEYPYVLLSMTVLGHEDYDEAYWNRLVDLLRKYDIAQILKDPEVSKRCNDVVGQNNQYKFFLEKYTRMEGHVSVTDFRSLDKTPPGNRFLSYCLFPDSVVNVKIRHDNKDQSKLIVSVGHSIFNRNCQVNVGRMLSQFEGGGHEKDGSCTFNAGKAGDYIPRIIEILKKNKK
ncbi:MAG: exopolyphosphatase [Deltaproteobacteria bacterium]|nr:exopolyphosphatase [Deltaproteobacteria bacterium]